MKLAYRPDIDGLRAIAVLAVIAGHLPEKFLTAGFLGVDVFFVISGFVVSASLLGQTESRLRDIYAQFLARRFKRLLPALFTCVAVTAFVVLAIDPYPNNSIHTGVASLFGFANIVLFNMDLDYFAASARFNAFTHTWSLGVEEQFYIVFPLFAWLFYFRFKGSKKLVLPVALAVFSLISVVLFVRLYADHQSAVYYLMPMRIWELGFGSLIYLASGRNRPVWLEKLLMLGSPAALAILFSSFFASQQHAMPATLVAVAMTGLLLLNNERSLSHRLLELPPFVYTGKISYSLYLWHWPVVTLGPMLLSTDWRHSLLYLVAMGIAAICSYHFIEKPLRYRTWSRSNIGDVSRGLSGSALLAVLILFAANKAGSMRGPGYDTEYPPHYLPSISKDRSPDPACSVNGNSRPLKWNTIDNCTVEPNAGSGMPMIWAMGDSHAGHLQGMLYEVHETLGIGVHLISTPGNAFPFRDKKKEFAPRVKIYTHTSRNFKAGDIVLISRMYLSRSTPPVMWVRDTWFHRVGMLADELAKNGMYLLVAGPAPTFSFEDIRSCDLEEKDSCSVERALLEPAIEEVMEKLATLEAKKKNIIVFDIFEAVCPATQKYCYPDNGRSYLYRDKDHFNVLGSMLLAKPLVQLLRESEVLTPD